MQQLRFAICVVGQLDMVFLVVSRCIVSYFVGSYFIKLIFISLSSRFVRKLTLLMSLTKRKFGGKIYFNCAVQCSIWCYVLMIFIKFNNDGRFTIHSNLCDPCNHNFDRLLAIITRLLAIIKGLLTIILPLA